MSHHSCQVTIWSDISDAWCSKIMIINYMSHLLHCGPSWLGVSLRQKLPAACWGRRQHFSRSHTSLVGKLNDLNSLFPTWKMTQNDLNRNVHKQDGFSFRSNSQKCCLPDKNDWFLFFTCLIILLWIISSGTTEGKILIKRLIACCLTYWDSSMSYI